MAKIQNGWKVREGILPCKVTVPALTHLGPIDPHIVEHFIDDLNTHFTFENPTRMVPQYLGYLTQPMICHFMPGQNPVYFYKGPTHSGKGYLGNILAGRIYCTQFGPGVCETNFKTGAYELNVLMGKASQSPYIFFDEIAYVSNKELKFIDNLATQQQLEIRKLHVGYASIPNHLTVTLTAINKEFSDETKARLVEIGFTKSSPEIIKKFNEKWGPKTPELLAALFSRVSLVDFTKDIPDVPHRRTGFGILQKALKDGFGIDVAYPISQNPNEILDTIVRMHESPAIHGVVKGIWTRYTPKQVTDFYNHDNPSPMKAEYMPASLTTALGYKATEDHPAYSKEGYAGESEKHYHIKLTEEGQGESRNLRRYVYVRSAEESNSKSAHGDPANEQTTTTSPSPLTEPNQDFSQPPASDEAPVSSSDSNFQEFDIEGGSFPAMEVEL